ncbi:MAG: hypothetical protein QG641_2519, partial [Candidatus Poribacteria bacterium]|nr:hypothetical protein [Candidatus Poribacteria bacterium]
MKNVFRISALLTAALMVFIMIGCGGGDEDTEKDTTPPSLVSTNPASGANIAANGTVSMVFSEAMKEVTVAGSAGTVALGADGKSAVWTPTGEMAVGNVSLSINGSDKAGNALTAVTVALVVIVADNSPPDIDAAGCDPKNGATAVDPATVSKIVITFSEAMSEAKLDSFEPKDAKVDSKFDGSKTLTISFLGGYKLSNEMEIIATVSGKDGA